MQELADALTHTADLAKPLHPAGCSGFDFFEIMVTEWGCNAEPRRMPPGQDSRGAGADVRCPEHDHEAAQ
jgi:hypothetical protein